MYVRLGFEWEVLRKKTFVWLSNVVTRKLFSIEFGVKQDILNDIENGIKEETLIEKYGME